MFECCEYTHTYPRTQRERPPVTGNDHGGYTVTMTAGAIRSQQCTPQSRGVTPKMNNPTGDVRRLCSRAQQYVFFVI